MESFGITQLLTNCTLKIGFDDPTCVLEDENSTDEMKNLALGGLFVALTCSWRPEYMDFDEGVCYHTSVNLAFTS